MTDPILVSGAAGGQQGATGARVLELLNARGIPVRAFVRQRDERAERLRALGAEVVQGDLLDPAAVHRALQGVRRAYFLYPVADGLLEATTIFARAAREAGTELVVNLSQARAPATAPSFRNLQHRLADQVFDWAQVGAVHLWAPPFYENVRALIATSVATDDAIYLPWGPGDAAIPLVGAEDVARVAAALLSGDTPPEARGYDLVAAAPTVNEIADTLSSVLRRPIRYVEISDERWRQVMEGRINAHALDHLSHLWAYFRTTPRDTTMGGNGAIAAVTGRAPQSLAQFFQMNVEAFGGVTDGRTATTQGDATVA
jgi:uncharacterized protein YbjT (DUF2867 family)